MIRANTPTVPVVLRLNGSVEIGVDHAQAVAYGEYRPQLSMAVLNLIHMASTDSVTRALIRFFCAEVSAPFQDRAVYKT